MFGANKAITLIASSYRGGIDKNEVIGHDDIFFNGLYLNAMMLILHM